MLREMSMPRCPHLSTRLPILEDEVYRELAESPVLKQGLCTQARNIFTSIISCSMIKQLIARRLVGEVQKQWSVSMQVGCELVEHYQLS